MAEQNISPADQELINQRQRTLLDQAQQQREALRNPLAMPEPPGVSEIASEGVCYPITHIRFQGGEQLSHSAQEALVRPYRHRCLSAADIHQLVRSVTHHYISRGYITSQAWLQPQDVASGTLTLSIREGRVDAISLEETTPLMLRTTFPGVVGQVLNLRDIEQGMEQLNRLPSQQVTIDILSGEREGYSTLALRRTSARLPVGFTLNLDNSGQKSTGTGQINAALWLDNPLRLADRWQLSAGRNSHPGAERRSRQLSGDVSIPYGYWLFGYQYAWNDFYNDVSLMDNRFRYDGSSKSQRLSAGRLLYRDGVRRVGLDLGLSRRRTENRMAGQRLVVSSPTLSALSVGLNYSATLYQGYFTLNPAISHGLPILGATADPPESEGTPRSQFRKFSLSSSYFYPLTDSTYYLTSAYAQTSPDNLYAAERLSLGGQYSVRGFKEQALAGNRGGYWRNEINWQIKTLPALGELTLTGMLDGGWLPGERGRTDGGGVIGAAAGLSLNGRWLTQSVTLGKPLAYPAQMQPDRWVTYWQASLSL